MKQVTEAFLIDIAKQQVLLGLKKNGIGEGNIVGIGGHIDAGETAEQAITREIMEEVSMTVAKADLQKSAEISFIFPHKAKWTMHCHVYLVTEWQGEPVESAEIRPQWFPINALPTDRMWADAKHWLACVLNGEKLKAEFVFSADNQTIDTMQLDWQQELL